MYFTDMIKKIRKSFLILKIDSQRKNMRNKLENFKSHFLFEYKLKII